MERLGTITARIESVAQLKEVVAAMRSLAAMRMQQAAEMLNGARRYADIIAAALSQTLLLDGQSPARPARAGRHALLVFSAEHGFVGGYAEALSAAAVAAAPDLILAVGTKGAQSLTDAGRPPDWVIPMASHAGALPDVARRVADEVGRRLGAGEFSSLGALYGQVREGARWQVIHQALLPADLGRFRKGPAGNAPLHHLPVPDLLARIVEEHLLADLALAATESLAAENASRLEAMTTAGDNIDRKLDDLRDQERILRQEQITDELLDVINGAELLFGGRRSGR